MVARHSSQTRDPQEVVSYAVETSKKALQMIQNETGSPSLEDLLTDSFKIAHTALEAIAEAKRVGSLSYSCFLQLLSSQIIIETYTTAQLGEQLVPCGGFRFSRRRPYHPFLAEALRRQIEKEYPLLPMDVHVSFAQEYAGRISYWDVLYGGLEKLREEALKESEGHRGLLFWYERVRDVMDSFSKEGTAESVVSWDDTVRALPSIEKMNLLLRAYMWPNWFLGLRDAWHIMKLEERYRKNVENFTRRELAMLENLKDFFP